MKTSESIAALAGALAKAQAEISNPEKNAKNPHFKSDYADLAGVLSVVRPAFSAQGLSVIQMPSTSETGQICLTTRVMHESGEWIEDMINIPVQGNNLAQAVGSVITYLRRYSLAALAGVHQADDDGETNTGKRINLKQVHSPDELARFGESMREALENGDYMTIGRSLKNKEHATLWEEANKGTTASGGQFDSKHKKMQSDLSAQYRDTVIGWAIDFGACLDAQDEDGANQIIEDIHAADKSLFFAQLNPAQKDYVKAYAEKAKQS